MTNTNEGLRADSCVPATWWWMPLNVMHRYGINYLQLRFMSCQSLEI